MGELQQRYQQRLGEVTRSHNAQPQIKFLNDSLKAELEGAVMQIVFWWMFSNFMVNV